MHGRGSGPSAPASNTAGRGDAGGTPQTARPCRVVPRGFPDSRRRGSNRRRLAPIRLPRTPIRAEPDGFAPIRAESDCIGRISTGKRKSAGKGKKKKKKKKKIKPNGMEWIFLRYCCRWTDLLLRVLLCIIF